MRRNQSERDRAVRPRRRIAPQSAALRKAIATLDIGYVIRDSPQGGESLPAVSWVGVIMFVRALYHCGSTDCAAAASNDDTDAGLKV